MDDIGFECLDTKIALNEFYQVLDRDYQFDSEQDSLACMEGLITGFHRLRAEPLRFFVRRLDSLDVKLRELGMEWAPTACWLDFGASVSNAFMADPQCTFEYGEEFHTQCSSWCAVPHVWPRCKTPILAMFHELLMT